MMPRVSLYLTQGLRERIKPLAEAEKRSVSWWASRELERAVEAAELNDLLKDAEARDDS